MIQIGLLGFGTVGRATYEILQEEREKIEGALGRGYQVKKILVRNPEKYEEMKDLITKDIQEIIEDPDIDLIIELTGEVDGMIGPIQEAIKEKKNIISANKALISKYFEDLSQLAADQKVHLKYEAAVGGAIPILSQVEKLTRLNEIYQVQGVLNGTCNFILSEMEKGKSYEQALKQAQKLGFAEEDPSADVSGLDTLRKLRILASLLFERSIKEGDIELKGIDKISLEDIGQAQAQGKRYKLVARADQQGCYQVQPELVDPASVFGGLEGGENAVIVSTSNGQDLVFQGPGAGGRETAFSVLSDFLDIYAG